MAAKDKFDISDDDRPAFRMPVRATDEGTILAQLVREEMAKAGIPFAGGKPVPIEVGGLTLHIRSMSLPERIAFYAWGRANPARPLIDLHLFVRGVCDEQGALRFAPKDIPQLADDLDPDKVGPIVHRIMNLNKMK